MSAIPSFKLSSGRKIPAIALGTWESPNDVVAHAVYDAIKSGYRHIDTAAIYGNEAGVGAGLKRAIEELGVKRSEIFLTTKLWLTEFHNVEKALDDSLERLFPGDKEAYVDLYLMHWPFAMKADGKTWDSSIDFIQAWHNMEKLPESKTRDIGISNFTIANTKKLLEHATKTPVVNQVELHTRLPQPKLVKWLLSGDYGVPAHNGKVIIPEAYSPMARGNLDDPTIKKIAEKHNVSPANVVLSWGISRNTVVLPKSVHADRIAANLKYIELDKDDIETINEISKHSTLQRYCDFTNCGFDVFHDNEDSK